MTRKEAERQTRQLDTLRSLGFTRDEAESLRRISMTLRRWFELECGDSNEFSSWAIERDDNGLPYLVRHIYRTGNRALHTGAHTTRTRIPDRETGAQKRLAAIVDARNKRCYRAGNYLDPNDPRQGMWLTTYIQTDPRGAALYILRPGDVPDGGDPSAYYNRGVCVY